MQQEQSSKVGSRVHGPVQKAVIGSQHHLLLRRWQHTPIRRHSYKDGPSQFDFERRNSPRLGAIEERPVDSAIAGSKQTEQPEGEKDCSADENEKYAFNHR